LFPLANSRPSQLWLLYQSKSHLPGKGQFREFVRFAQPDFNEKSCLASEMRPDEGMASAKVGTDVIPLITYPSIFHQA
jgi:hypothetical protein